jgi:hypothetical protein
MKTISGIEFASEHNGTDVFRLIELAYEQGQKDGHSEQLGTNLAEVGTDCISRAAAIDALRKLREEDIEDYGCEIPEGFNQDHLDRATFAIKQLPPIQPEKEIAKRVLWTGWKGCRGTRYKCPNCKKPVKNDDIYCHRCGQKLMFPHISFTDYVPGEKQETIVRWDDE